MVNGVGASSFFAESLPVYEDVAIIQLTQGQFAVVDAADYLRLRQWKWYFMSDRSHPDANYGYAIRSGRTADGEGRQRIVMHREIAGTPPGLVCDHINGDPLDNRRANLRNITQAENLKNRAAFRTNRSGIKGVRFDAKKNRWATQIQLYFDTKEEAEAMYKKVTEVTHGDLARGAHESAPQPLSLLEKQALWENLRSRRIAESREFDDYLGS